MKKWNLILKGSIFLLVVLMIVIIINESNKEIIHSTSNNVIYDSGFVGYLIIPKIDMKLGFYDYSDIRNDVDKNIEIIDTGINNTYLFAAHSGNGKRSFFTDLKYLEKEDNLYLEIDNIIKEYKVINIRREVKRGKVNIKNEENMLILTTCDKVIKGYQLIIEGKLV